MPWLLLALGLAVVLYAGYIRTGLHTVSTVCLQHPAHRTAPIASNQPNHAPRPGAASAGTSDCPPAGRRGPTATRRKTTRESTSDELLAAIFGAGAILMLAGAFYSRVTKISIAGNALSAEMSHRDDADLIAHVRVELEAQVADLLAPDGATLDPERVSEAVTRTAMATAIAREEARELRLFAAGSTFRSPIALEPERLQDLREGNPLPADVLERLAKRAVKEAFEEPEGS
jgi:hypothetical protein